MTTKLSPSFQQHSREEYLNDLHRSLIDTIEHYLKTNNLNRTQFAEQLGFSKGYISQLLNGKKDTKLSSLVNLAFAVNKVPHLTFTDRPLRQYQFPETAPSLVRDPDHTPPKQPFYKIASWDSLMAIEQLSSCTSQKAQIDALRPFDKAMEAHVLNQYLRIWNFNSNAIEGNKLTYGETEALLLYGLTAKGKPLKDHLDVLGHEEAVDLMFSMVQGERTLTHNDIRQLHQVLLKQDYQQKAQTSDGRRVYRTIRVGVYKSEPNHVIARDGKKHYYAEPNAVPGLMQELLDWYASAVDAGELHPLVIASVFHHEFVAIHPFDDGNGRIGRILMNFILLRAGYPVTVIDVASRDEYYESLQAADKGKYEPLVRFIGERLLNSLEIQLTTARGEDIGGSKWDS